MITNPPNKDVEAVAYVPVKTSEDGHQSLLWANVRMFAHEQYCDYPMLPLFTAAQLKEVELRAYERAARVCEKRQSEWEDNDPVDGQEREAEWKACEAGYCADAIRKLAGEV